MKNILLLVHDDDGQFARLHTAIDLTCALDGHLICIDVTPSPVYAGNAYGGFGASLLLNDERENEARNRARTKERVAGANISWSWEDATGDFAQCVIDASNLADLIVLNRALDDYPLPDMRTITSRVLMHARKPIVAVPEEVESFNAKGRAIIAWDGQESVAATMRACVPLLQLASDVEIFMVRDGAAKTEPEEAAAYLARHGIHANVKIVEDGVHHADVLIENAARHWRAEYILMGAYSHGRLMEAFGGVTKRMLSNCKLPLVIGH
ncbi:universal stress protein UspA [Sphingobium sp. BS19]|nr:universal stress protein UspA [Sphingobium sp. BS19]